MIHPIIVLAIENVHFQSKFWFWDRGKEHDIHNQGGKTFPYFFLFQFVSKVLTCILCFYIISACINVFASCLLRVFLHSCVYIVFASRLHALMCLLCVFIHMFLYMLLCINMFTLQVSNTYARKRMNPQYELIRTKSIAWGQANSKGEDCDGSIWE